MKIGELIGTAHHFLAHPEESIEEHVEKCKHHFERILREKELSSILNNLIKVFRDSEVDSGNAAKIQEFIMESIESVIVLHDIGKINQLFQKKIGNPEFQNSKLENKIGFQHAIVSAILYLDYYLKQLDEWEVPIERQQKYRLIMLIFLNSYIIARHHTDLTCFRNYVEAFYADGDYAYRLEEIQKGILPALQLEYSFLENRRIMKRAKQIERVKWKGIEEYLMLTIYHRLMYSLLLASDYYATTEQVSKVYVEGSGVLYNIDEYRQQYEKSSIYQAIREYEKDRKKDITELNMLRSELFLDTEEELKNHINRRLFYLEAPTGTGKSNTALNLSFRLLENDATLKKLFYIYPFNTLVEQNEQIMERHFGGKKELYARIHVVNSQHSLLKKQMEEEKDICYEKLLLDRQFLNYPITLSTHVTLFDIFFGERKESAFSFHQLANSVIVLDEIQSYRNSIWTEIITFLNAFAKYLNLRIIIMSATLPELNWLSLCEETPVTLVKWHDKYYQNPLLLKRSRIHYDLLAKKCSLELLLENVMQELKKKKKVLIEFITKKSAELFWNLCEDYQEELEGSVQIITGDDTVADRKRILNELKNSPDGEPFLLIATQVIEAGVDISNIEVGFKDISILDSDEQFMGRVNRSCNMERIGEVYFFSLDSAGNVYKNDARTQREFTLENPLMQQCLEQKDFKTYYQKVMEQIRINNESADERENVQVFFGETVKDLDMPAIAERMRLIKEDERKISVFFNRNICLENGVLCGAEVWQRYKEVVFDNSMDYAEREILLQDIRVSMNYFIYEVSSKAVFQYDERNCEQVGTLYYIEDGESFFRNGRFDREQFENAGQMII